MGCKTSQIPGKSFNDDLGQQSSIKVYKSSKKIHRQATLKRGNSSKIISSSGNSKRLFEDDFELNVI